MRDYVANMVYVGILAQVFGIDMDMIDQALEFHFKGKQKPIELNFSMVKNAHDWAAANLTKTDAYSVESIESNRWLYHGGWQHGRRPRRHLWRRAVRCLVPDHPRPSPGGITERLSADVSQRPRDRQEYLRGHPGRR